MIYTVNAVQKDLKILLNPVKVFKNGGVILS